MTLLSTTPDHPAPAIGKSLDINRIIDKLTVSKIKAKSDE